MSNSNSIDLTLEVILQRLAMITGGATDAEIVQHLGLSKSAINNWRSRGTVPYKTLMLHLVAAGYSLDWFFAPHRPLKVPAAALTPEAQELLAEQATSYEVADQKNGQPVASRQSKRELEQEDSAELLLTAMQHIQAVLSRYGVQANRYELRLLLRVYERLEVNENLRTLTIEDMVATMASASERKA